MTIKNLCIALVLLIASITPVLAIDYQALPELVPDSELSCTDAICSSRAPVCDMTNWNGVKFCSLKPQIGGGDVIPRVYVKMTLSAIRSSYYVKFSACENVRGLPDNCFQYFIAQLHDESQADRWYRFNGFDTNACVGDGDKLYYTTARAHTGGGNVSSKAESSDVSAPVACFPS